MHSRRALLYVPGNDERKIRKAATLGADSVCLDLEDGVALDRKAEARALAPRLLRELDFGRTERLGRINAVGSGMEQEDLAVLLRAYPDGIIVPKVSSATQLLWVDAQIDAFERAQGLASGSIRLLALIETARGVLNLAQVAGATSRLDALLLGAEDLVAETGAIRTPEAWEVLYARSAVVMAAAAFELQAIDMLDTDYKNVEQLREHARQGAALGFAGKQVIHPNQIGPVQEAFTPGDAAIAEARRIVQAGAEHGTGAFGMDGRMIERPIIRAAERVLARARAAGKIA